jgi:hypothetical protein
MALSPKKYYDERILRRIQITRYQNGQVNYIRGLINDMNKRIAHHIIGKEKLESKALYQDCRVYVRKRCMEYRDRVYKYLQKEIKGFVKEEQKWEYQNSPKSLKKVDPKKSVRGIFFEAYSDTDTIKSYVTRIFNQIFQIWNSQLSIAYRTGGLLEDMVKIVLGGNPDE